MVDHNFIDHRINFIKLIIISSILIRGASCDTSDDDVCWNPECKNLTEDVVGNMLPSLNPCEDFYEYACGNFVKNHPLPTPDSNQSIIEVILKKLYYRVKQLLSMKVISTESEVVQKSKKLFQACANLTKINRNGIKNLKNKMDEIGGFPMMYPPDEFDDSRPWEEVHAYYARTTGFGALFNIDVDQDYRNRMFNAIYLDQPAGIFGYFGRITDPGNILKYSDFIKNVMTILVSSPDVKNKATPQAIEQDIKDVFRFRYLLQMTMSSGPTRTRPTYAPYTIDGLQGATPTPMTDTQVPTNWLKLFKGVFRIIKNADIQGSTEILIREPSYILGLTHRIMATQLRVIVNHIHLYFVERHLKYMPENIMALLHDITEQINGFTIEKVERWQKCIQDHPMQHVLSSIYIHWYFPQAERTKVSRLIKDIKEAMKKRIERSAWLDASTKQAALLKLSKMRNVIGSDEWYRSYESQLQEYYQGQKVGWNYLQNVLDFEQNEYKIELGYLTGESTRVSNNEFPILPNAYYENANIVVINVGQMQPPFYHSKFPPVVNYPGLGTVIAHEISHGYDRTGRRYDHDGVRVNWWSSSSSSEYRRRAQCIKDQFSSYSYKELESIRPTWKVNGSYTYNENFADLLGIIVSYDAYKTKMQEFVKPSRIPNLPNFDNEKVFFLIYANTFCEHANTWTLEHRARYDTHTTARLRVNGPLSNMQEFSDAFGCNPGTPMNRANKCEIW